MKFFITFVLCLDSSVSRATVPRLKSSKFESCLRQTLLLLFLLFFFTWKCFSYTYVKILYENVINLIISETLKVLFSNILLKKYYFTMRCGLDKKNDLKGDYN